MDKLRKMAEDELGKIQKELDKKREAGHHVHDDRLKLVREITMFRQVFAPGCDNEDTP